MRLGQFSRAIGAICALAISLPALAQVPLPWSPGDFSNFTYEKHVYGYFHVEVDANGHGTAKAIFATALRSTEDLFMFYGLYDSSGALVASGQMDAHMKATWPGGNHREYREVAVDLTPEQWGTVKCFRTAWGRGIAPEVQALFDFPTGPTIIPGPEYCV